MGIIAPKPCTLIAERDAFEVQKKIYESTLLTFKGVDGYDVYNCSVPFTIGGKRYLYGRVEKFDEWISSKTLLFEETGQDEFTRVVDHTETWQLEDPFITKINGEMVFGGTHVTKDKGRLSDYCCEFYRGLPDRLRYFTSGPPSMKDIRLIQLADGRVGIFSHIRTPDSCLTGFVIIKSIEEMGSDVIRYAKPIDHSAFGDAWGGVNQAYLLSTGKVGCIAHHGYLTRSKKGVPLSVYCCTSFVFDPETRKSCAFKIIGTKNCFPYVEPKLPKLDDCAFVSGIVMRDDGKCDLYSGLGDTHQGRITIDYPFEGYGSIVSDLDF